jgi:hypothetical protein
MQVVFAPDRSWIALRVASGDGSSSTIGSVLRIALPAGEVQVLAEAATSVEALGDRGALLIQGPASEGTSMMVHDGGGKREIASRVCYHKATPDGSRVYFMKCYASIVTALEVVDVATGAITELASSAIQGTLTISSDSRWAAFLVRDRSAGDMVRVVDAKGDGYGIASQTPASRPFFAGNRLLLFTVNRSGSFPSPGQELRAHVMGSDDTSYLVATGREADGARVSSDGSLVLGASTEVGEAGAQLYAIRVDGTGESLVASDLYAYRAVSRPLRPFSFDSGGRWIPYLHGGLGVSVTSITGGAARRLAQRGTFQVGPNPGQAVVLDEVDQRVSAGVRLVALDGGEDLLSFQSDGTISDVAALAGAPRMVLVEATAGGSMRLRFVSSKLPGSTVLGEWTRSSLLRASTPSTAPYGSYPVDPTGCFTILDTDLGPRPGVSLLLLPE